ncbi:translation initiation factor 2 [Pseudomonas sp. SDI]|nr:translation initiation factor 2 [Pseudomonas sp. SDI]
MLAPLAPAAESPTSASKTQPAPAAVKKPVRAAAKPAAKPAPRNKAAASSKGPSKSQKRKTADVIAAPMPKVKLDLSLPPDMVKELQPSSQIEAQVRKPLLPALFGEKPATQSPFQLNGRLLSNEMQLQLRNEARQQDIEGAAIEFEFKQ